MVAIVTVNAARVAAHGTLSGFAGQIPACVLEELRQETVARLIHVAQVEHPKALARRIARNLAIDWLRRERRTVPLDGCEDSPWERVDAALDVHALRVCANEAPSLQRQLLLEHVFDGMPVEHLIARVVGGERHAVGDAAWNRARDTVYKRRRRAIRWLRERAA